uniref:Uncharacterized protein n=1 Tax=Cannabis sativa TaxID=3483 RepID=A0A803QJW1_CANSA
MWSTHPQFSGIVSKVWQKPIKGTQMFQLVTRLKELKGELKKLNKESFSDIVAKEVDMKTLLIVYQEKLQKDPFNNDLQLKEKEAKETYIKTQKEMYLFLQQKVKLSWVRGGDDNTTLFYTSIKDRRRQNRILSIESKEGTRCEDPEQVAEAFLAYYKSLLGGKMSNRRHVKRSVMAQGPLVTNEQVVLLLRDITKEEVREALFGIPEVKRCLECWSVLSV